MATYTGDATIVDVINASASRSGTNYGTSVAYTCPAGIFAKIQLNGASAEGLTGGGGSCSVGSNTIVSVGPSTTASANLSDYPVDIVINEGQSVSCNIPPSGSGGTVSITVTIVEFNKP